MLKREKNIDHAVDYHPHVLAGFLAGDLFLRGDSGEEDLFLTIAPKLSGTSGG